MAGRSSPPPVVTENFALNLETIREFLEPQGKAAFERLLDRLFQHIIPILGRFPRSGRSFLGRSIRSQEAQALADRLKSLVQRGDDIREFIFDDYLILYLIRQKGLFLFSIKHHRQLSFDLSQFWFQEK